MSGRRLAVAACVALAGCSAHEAYLARRIVLGMSRAQMEECAGIPEHVETIGPDMIVTYRFETKGVGLTAGVPLLGSLSLSSAGQCTAVWTLRADRVVELNYTSDSAGLAPPEMPCGALVRGCLETSQ